MSGEPRVHERRPLRECRDQRLARDVDVAHEVDAGAAVCLHRVLREGDEIGLHVHADNHLLFAAGVTPKAGLSKAKTLLDELIVRVQGIRSSAFIAHFQSNTLCLFELLKHLRL